MACRISWFFCVLLLAWLIVTIEQSDTTMDEFPAKSGSDSMEQEFNDEMEESHEDLYAKLESQENDLMLAAELGKALLDKNEEISKDRETIVLNSFSYLMFQINQWFI